MNNIYCPLYAGGWTRPVQMAGQPRNLLRTRAERHETLATTHNGWEEEHTNTSLCIWEHFRRSHHVFASRALNMSGYFDQSAHSTESRSMVTLLQRLATYQKATRSICICDRRNVWPCHTATENFTIWFNFRMTPMNITDYCFPFCNNSNTAIGDFVVVIIPLAWGTSYKNFVAEVISK